MGKLQFLSSWRAAFQFFAFLWSFNPHLAVVIFSQETGVLLIYRELGSALVLQPLRDNLYLSSYDFSSALISTPTAKYPGPISTCHQICCCNFQKVINIITSRTVNLVRIRPGSRIARNSKMCKFQCQFDYPSLTYTVVKLLDCTFIIYHRL